MRLGDSDVEEMRRLEFRDPHEPRSVRHRRGDGDDAIVLRDEPRHQLPEDVGVGRLRGRRLDLAAAAHEPLHAVVLPRVELGDGDALPLGGQNVEENRPLHHLHPLEDRDQLAEVVAVDRAEVAEAEVLEEHARREEALQAFLHLAHDLPERLALRHLLGEVPDVGLHPVEVRARDDPGQVAGDGADVRRDRHRVVVQDDDQPPPGGAGVVEPLVGQTAGHAAVPDHRHDAIVLPGEVAGGGHPQRGGDGGGGVPGAEGVVGRSLRLKKPLIPPNWRIVRRASRRPVSTLWTYPWWPTSQTIRSRGVSKR